MCIPPTSVKAAQAKAFAASGLVKDARLDLVQMPGTSFNPIGFLELPIFLALAWVYRAQFETKMLGPMFLIYVWKECIPMSVCLHRYFSHKGFKCGRVTQFALYIGGCLASQVRKKRPTSPVFYVREPRVFHARRATRRRGIETRRGERGGGLALHVRAGRPNRTRDARDPPPRAHRVRLGFGRTDRLCSGLLRTILYARGGATNKRDVKNAYVSRLTFCRGARARSGWCLTVLPPFPSLCLLSDRLFVSSQGAPLWWASKHRRHHAHCDTKADPHSPVAFSKLYAWMGWCYSPKGEGPFGSGHDQEYMQDHLAFPELTYMENFYWVPVFAVHAGFYASLGPAWAVYCSMMSGCLCQCLTLYFNVMFHSHPEPTTEAEGAKFANAKGTCRAVDLPFDPLANTFGEAYHGWHHKHPLAYKRPGLDLPYWTLIKPALALGIFWGPNKMHAVKVA